MNTEELQKAFADLLAQEIRISNKIEFILEHQAKTDMDLDVMREKISDMSKRIDNLVESVETVNENIDSVREISAEFGQNIAQGLKEAFNSSRKFSELIHQSSDIFQSITNLIIDNRQAIETNNRVGKENARLMEEMIEVMKILISQVEVIDEDTEASTSEPESDTTEAATSEANVTEK